MSGSFLNVGVAVLVILVFGVTLFVVFLIWRNGYTHGWRRARGAPPECPACGYNLTGINECRCPECGEHYSLDELWHAAILKRRKKQDS